jgi:hypothetical protein
MSIKNQEEFGWLGLSCSRNAHDPLVSMAALFFERLATSLNWALILSVDLAARPTPARGPSSFGQQTFVAILGKQIFLEKSTTLVKKCQWLCKIVLERARGLFLQIY